MILLKGVIKVMTPLLPEARRHPVQHLRLGLVAEDVLLQSVPAEDEQQGS